MISSLLFESIIQISISVAIKVLTNREDGIMPERATIPSLITKAQTVTVAIVGSAILAKLVTTETQVSIL